LKRERNFEKEEERGPRRRNERQDRGGYDQYNGRNDDRRYNQGDPRLKQDPEPVYQQPALTPADSQRLEQAQKAQHILSMLTQQSSQAPSLTSAFQPTNIRSPPVQQQHAAPFIQPVPPTESQSTQLQQLLGLLVCPFIHISL
jgi:hypothetical protein